VTVNGVVDRSPAANPILANSTKTFTPQYGLNLAVAFEGSGRPRHPLNADAADRCGRCGSHPNYNNVVGQVNLGAGLGDVDGASTP